MLQEAVRARQKPVAEGLAKAFDLIIRERVLGGIPIVEISPANPASDDKVGVYAHGGAYIQGAARNPQAVLFSAATGLRVISIEYTLAPHSKWQDTTAQVLAVFSALAEEGYSPSHTVLGGDSAGGGLAAGSLLRMRDEGMEMPAALVLWSPWADISETGDTYLTLRDAEVSFTYNNVLGPAARVYADPDDHGHPYVSPVYGDFNEGFPPTLIQGGTREIFLSNFGFGGVRKLCHEHVRHPFIKVQLHVIPSLIERLIESNEITQEYLAGSALNKCRWEALVEITVNRRNIGMPMVIRIRIGECCRTKDIVVGKTHLGIAQREVGVAGF